MEANFQNIVHRRIVELEILHRMICKTFIYRYVNTLKNMTQRRWSAIKGFFRDVDHQMIGIRGRLEHTCRL